MDIVTRLKKFMQHLNMPVTQFADACKIPRPTMSQLLNGRNKKVSDELIRKFHTEFPELNVMWLLFGEGDMLKGENGETSGAQNSQLFTFAEGDPAENKVDTPPLSLNFDDADFEQKKSDMRLADNMVMQDALNTGSADQKDTKQDCGAHSSHTEAKHSPFDSYGINAMAHFTHASPKGTQAERSKTADDGSTTISFSNDGNRKIVNIIVYYSDNSFEGFVPGSPQ